MIKELWILVKMLFVSRPSDVVYKELEVVEMNHFPFKGFKALSWCGKIIHRIGTSAVNNVAMNHEKIHVVQALYCDDSWVKYYLSYLWNWLKHCPWVAPSKACYYINKYEAEAFVYEGVSRYCDLDYYRYSDFLLNYGKLNAKKRWRECGGTKEAWIKWLREAIGGDPEGEEGADFSNI